MRNMPADRQANGLTRLAPPVPEMSRLRTKYGPSKPFAPIGRPSSSKRIWPTPYCQVAPVGGKASFQAVALNQPGAPVKGAACKQLHTEIDLHAANLWAQKSRFRRSVLPARSAAPTCTATDAPLIPIKVAYTVAARSARARTSAPTRSRSNRLLPLLSITARPSCC